MEQSDYSIRIAPHNCAGCYRCVRACEAKAIGIRNNGASIDQSECTRCGTCRKVCPHGIISMRNDTDSVRRMIKTSDTVFASLDPQWAGEFAGIPANRIIEALKLLGFSGVGETLLGGMKYDEAVGEQLRRNPRTGISTACPVVVRLIRHHYPELAEKLLPVAHPAVLHARMIRHWKGQTAKVVYITPCVAAKSNPDEISELDAVVTFDELRRWMKEDGVLFDLIPGNESYRFEPGETDRNSPILSQENKAQRLTYSGMPVIRELLGQLNTDTAAHREPLLLELWGCTGGCAGAADGSSTIAKELALHQYYDNRAPENPVSKLPFIPTIANYPALPSDRFQVAASQIEEALAAIGKFTERDMHNCNGCGYETCRDFGRALCMGKAEAEMCLSYTRLLAQKKFGALLQRMPSGIMLVNANLQIVEANRNMAQLLGPQAEQLFDRKSGMRGADLRKLASFEALLQQVLNTGTEVAEQDVRMKGKMLHISAFTIEPHRLVGVMVSNLMLQGVQSDEMIQRTRQVIRENLETVQQIAYLLGENASRTEAILNSIVTATENDQRA